MIYNSLSCDELVRACAESGNDEAWKEFVCRFGPVINRAIWRVARRYGDSDSATIQELVSDTYVKFLDDNCRVLRNFKARYPNAFYGMAGTVAANVARDHYRPARPPISDCDLSDLEDFLTDPHASGSGQIERRILFQEIDRILCAHCTSRDREIFWLYYSQIGLTAAEISRISRFNLDESGVESVLHRLKSLVRRKLAEKNENGGSDPDKAA